jgi:hypothetical protein
MVYTPVISAFRRLRQEEFNTSLGWIERPCLTKKVGGDLKYILPSRRRQPESNNTVQFSIYDILEKAEKTSEITREQGGRGGAQGTCETILVLRVTLMYLLGPRELQDTVGALVYAMELS